MRISFAKPWAAALIGVTNDGRLSPGRTELQFSCEASHPTPLLAPATLKEVIMFVVLRR